MKWFLVQWHTNGEHRRSMEVLARSESHAIDLARERVKAWHARQTWTAERMQDT